MVEQWQAQKLYDQTGPMLNYLYRLKYRMEKTGRRTGKLCELVKKAHMAVFDLSVELHYLRCPCGVTRKGVAE
jgi:hypothetical protein